MLQLKDIFSFWKIYPLKIISIYPLRYLKQIFLSKICKIPQYGYVVHNSKILSSKFYCYKSCNHMAINTPKMELFFNF